jgi:hypothetical protein
MLLLMCVVMLGCKTPHEKAKDAFDQENWVKCLEQYSECDSLSPEDLLRQVTAMYLDGQTVNAKAYAYKVRKASEYMSEVSLARMAIEEEDYATAIVWLSAAKDHNVHNSLLRDVADDILQKATVNDLKAAHTRFQELKQFGDY